MNVKQEIAKLKAKLAELEAEVSKPLDCYFDDGFYIMHSGGVINSQSNCLTNYTQIRNKETAEAVAPLVQIQRALINFKCEHDPVFDGNSIEKLWAIERNMKLEKYDIYNYSTFYAVSEVWFSTRELAQSALDMLKRRNLV